MNRLNLITLGVRDMVESLHFYRDGLGFEVIVYGEESNPEVIFFNNRGTKISLFPMEQLAKDINEQDPPVLNPSAAAISLAYNGKSIQEVDEVFAKAAEAGARIVKQPQTVFWGGYSGYFQDPNGFYWEVAYGENWEFDDSDMLIMN
ncbi:VOC family protein [Sediminibacillus dalangtanensis]|uniref:VOC family protein n=1 Tax=Sediminibacillus dalangtanensis TaxID=2729421 RepID=A0ABX7VTC3_9BACI|nr:VOC family protein [Sediminibacillus dalangtanensis]QTM98840.1 VOC family protein [Sediminibacillus dalangtanensis]